MARLSVENRKEQIIKVAANTFAIKGFHKTNLSDIARLSEVSTSLIYKYFSTKEALLLSIPELLFNNIFETMESHLSMIRNPAEKLRAIIHLYLGAYDRSADYTAVFLRYIKNSNGFSDSKINRAMNRTAQQITAIIEQGIALNAFKQNTNPYLVQSMVLGAIDRLAEDKAIRNRYGSLKHHIDPLIDAIIGSIEQEPEVTVHDVFQSLVHQVSGKGQARDAALLEDSAEKMTLQPHDTFDTAQSEPGLFPDMETDTRTGSEESDEPIKPPHFLGDAGGNLPRDVRNPDAGE